MAEIKVIHAADRAASDADATTGIIRETAFEATGVWVGYVRAEPGRPSGWHHHGRHDTYFFVERGAIRMEFGPGGSLSVEAGPGDFVHVPAGIVHREVNSSNEAGSVVLIRVGEGPPVVNVDGPEG